MTDARRRRVLFVIAGMAENPGEGSALHDAETPGLDSLARSGRAGTVELGTTSPWDGFTALLGLPQGAAALGPVEALGAGVGIGAGQAAWRADFVTVDDRGLRDPAAGKVREPEAGLLLDAARAALGDLGLRRLEGHRNLAVGEGPPEFAPTPWEMVGRRPVSTLAESGRLRAWYAAALGALARHDVNSVRLDLLENPANALWFHGGGTAVPPGLRSPAGTDVVLVGRGRVTEGLARALGWKAAVVDGDEEALAAECLARVGEAGLVVVRTEAVLWATALGARARRDTLSLVDARLVRPVLGALEESDDWTAAAASDCVFDRATGAIVRRPVPVAMRSSGEANDGGRFLETVCERSGFRWAGGREFAARLAD